jgi:thymidine kinase
MYFFGILFSTHEKEMVDAISVSSLDEKEVPDSMFADKDVILVYEGQFLRSLLDFCERHANEERIVVVAALYSDVDRNPFGEVCNLVASKIVELIGGADKYQARCRGC